MMVTQGYQLLSVTSRSERQHAGLNQARELLAVGRMRLAQQLEKDPSYAGDNSTLEVFQGDLESECTAEIRIEKQNNPDATNVRWRIVAIYPLNQSGQFTSSWESE